MNFSSIIANVKPREEDQSAAPNVTNRSAKDIPLADAVFQGLSAGVPASVAAGVCNTVYKNLVVGESGSSDLMIPTGVLLTVTALATGTAIRSKQLDQETSPEAHGRESFDRLVGRISQSATVGAGITMTTAAFQLLYRVLVNDPPQTAAALFAAPLVAGFIGAGIAWWQSHK